MRPISLTYVPTLRLGLAQINPTVGQIAANTDLSRSAIRELAESGAQVIALPEMVITGYPVEDLALRPSFQSASEQAVHQLATDLVADGLGEHVVIIGFLRGTTSAESTTAGVPRGTPQNCAAVIHRGAVVATYAKHHLPNYGVFDEYRYFVPGNESVLVRAFNTDIAIAICEDLWQDGGPVARVRENQAGLLVVLNGSPFERDKDDVRLDLVTRRAKEANATLAYVNMVGGQDELVFDGDSIVVDKSGTVLARTQQFESELITLDLDLPDAGTHTTLPGGENVVVLETAHIEASCTHIEKAKIQERRPAMDEVYHALVLGLRDYVEKNRFPAVLLGLSGGIDSALVATIASDALGADRVYGVSLPSEYSSEHSRSDAKDLAERLGCHFRTVPIAPMVDSYLNELHFTGLAEENLQARVRGTTLMGISNQEGQLVLATGNKSELSVGYSTIYGDAVGGYAPIMDVPKVDVWALSRWRNELAISRGELPPIPENSIEKPPSAELRPDQKDSDSLPDYELLDAILELYVEHDLSVSNIVARGFAHDVVADIVQKTDRAEYKRRQYPPGTKISRKAFGRDRRLPMTNKWTEK